VRRSLGAAEPPRWEPMRALRVAPISARWARVGDDLAEVGEAVDGRAASAEGEVGGAQQRPVLRVAAEVGGRTRQVVAESPHTAAVTLLILDAVLEGAGERVEGGRCALVGGWDWGTAFAAGPVAGAELESWR